MMSGDSDVIYQMVESEATHCLSSAITTGAYDTHGTKRRRRNVHQPNEVLIQIVIGYDVPLTAFSVSPRQIVVKNMFQYRNRMGVVPIRESSSSARTSANHVDLSPSSCMSDEYLSSMHTMCSSGFD